MRVPHRQDGAVASRHRDDHRRGEGAAPHGAGVPRDFKREDFEGSGERKIAPKWAGGKSCTGVEYLAQIGLPNVYFHVTVAYAILRHAGVELGKQDFMGALPLRD